MYSHFAPQNGKAWGKGAKSHFICGQAGPYGGKGQRDVSGIFGSMIRVHQTMDDLASLGQLVHLGTRLAGATENASPPQASYPQSGALACQDLLASAAQTPSERTSSETDKSKQ